MCHRLQVLAVVFLCLFAAKLIKAAALMERYGQHFNQQNNGYLPPHGSAHFGDKTHSGAPAYKAGQTHAEAFEPIYNSYVPPASGAASLQYSREQPSSKAAIPMLIPLEQLSVPTEMYEPLPRYSNQQSRSHYNEVQISPNALSPLLMVEEPGEMYLTQNQNKTVEAAQLLASSLLEATAEAPLLRQPESAADASNVLNTTDVVIVKSHKNAYIIPTQLAKDGKSTMSARELYEMRHQFEKAYTVNQFIFIIKPERINFLNKLV